MPKPELVEVPSDGNNAKNSMPFCHRFYTPIAIIAQMQNPLNPKQVGIEARGQIAQFPCIKEKCMRWNAQEADCWDNVESKAHKTLADYAEIPSGAGGGQ